jgi:stage II sporulation protein P
MLLCTAAVILPCSFYALSTVDMLSLAEKTALVSAMVNMPEGSLALLKDRFRDKLSEKEAYEDGYYGEAPENREDITPYNMPYPQMESSASQEEGETSSSSASSEKNAVPKAPSPATDTTHVIPQRYRGTIVQENMAGYREGLLTYGAGYLRNYTEFSDEEIETIMKKGNNIQLEDTTEPQVLIFHTHATESYEPYDSDTYDTRNNWRTTDNNNNMVAVGNALEAQLKAAGIGVIHDTTQHDYPSYNGSYERSAETIKSYLEKYPSIKVCLDVHRDAIQREEDLIVKPVTEIDGKKAAQLMIITGSDDGTMNIPHWRENLRFAAAVQDQLEQDYPTLTRPIFFCYRKYNMDLTTGSLLFEVGSNANTLEESIYTANLVGKSLGKLLAPVKEK